MNDTENSDSDRPDLQKISGDWAVLNNVVEANASLDEGGPELARVNVISEDGSHISFHMDQELAHEFALKLSRRVVDRRYLDTDR